MFKTSLLNFNILLPTCFHNAGLRVQRKGDHEMKLSIVSVTAIAATLSASAAFAQDKVKFESRCRHFLQENVFENVVFKMSAILLST